MHATSQVESVHRKSSVLSSLLYLIHKVYLVHHLSSVLTCSILFFLVHTASQMHAVHRKLRILNTLLLLMHVISKIYLVHRKMAEGKWQLVAQPEPVLIPYV